jgi:hypothetical protein
MSKRTRWMQIRVTESEFQRIKNNVEATGHSTCAAYIRDLALSRGFILEGKIIETHHRVGELLNLLKLSRCIPAGRAMRHVNVGKLAHQSRHKPNDDLIFQ